MRLHDFIDSHREQILMEWESFARTVSHASGTMDVVALRDHADEMLTVIAADLKTSETPYQQAQKAMGRAARVDGLSTAAEAHGAARAESGFEVEEMVAEYRALRASVLRLWTVEVGQLKAEHIDDLIRFNEAIDQSLAESVAEFNENLEEAKEMFLAMLGHDLRTPLGAIRTSAEFMLETGELEEPHLSLTSRILSSASRTVAMVGDLLDFTRSRLGGGIPLAREKLDLGNLLREAVEEVSAARPDRRFRVDAGTGQIGEWDAARLRQALTNLITNASEHSPPGSDISVELHDEGDEVVVSVHNLGPAIPADRLDGLFNPMKAAERGSAPASGEPTGSLGLGLYIADRIVDAHDGWIEVESSEAEGTTFGVHLPRT